MATITHEPTLIQLKTTFLTTQITLLSTPLAPSPNEPQPQDPNPSPPLPPKTLTTALEKLNTKIKQHNNLVYGPQAKRNIAEQIDKLYWRAGERGVGILGIGEEWAERGCDYRKQEIILNLPPTWSSEATLQSPTQASRATQFSTLRQKLLDLNALRVISQERLENSRRLRDLLIPFSEEGGVQDNLVVRNGEMEGEMERMRRLMLRFERAREGDGGQREEEDGVVEMDGVGEDRKVIALLGGGR